MSKIHRFITTFSIDNKLIKMSNKEILDQIKNVLKLRMGESVILSRGDGIDLLAKLSKFDGGSVYLELEKIMDNNKEPTREVVLFCSVLKKENFELVAQKATEIGVFKIIPIVADRTVKTNLNLNRIRKIIKEASEQSGRGIIPELTEIASFTKAVEDLKNQNLNIFLDPLGEKLNNLNKDIKLVSVWIGPEGGWTDTEIDIAQERGFKISSLGPLTLRAETAAIISTYIACL